MAVEGHSATRLFEAIEVWARRTTTAPSPSITRWAFFVEGFHRHAVRVDGKWVDDYTMAKLLD